ncbi:MAG: hypothetical protein ABL886_13875, partial [Rhodoglobus sp.]
PPSANRSVLSRKSATPAAISAAAVTLHRLTADRGYVDAAQATVDRVSAVAEHQPIAYGAALSVLSSLAEPVRQLVVVGEDGADAAAVALARRWRGGLAAVVTAEQARQWSAAGFELFEGRATSPASATAYLCEDFVCRLPITSAVELAEALESSAPSG